MANFDSETKIRVRPFVKAIELSAGGKLTDDTELVTFAQKTVPTGYKAKANVVINVSLEAV
jgi:hypothetical protein